jgi:hypothetical protein
VISDHGDRALLVARRGESVRVARVDLVSKRQQPWCDVPLSAFALDFDGSVWYVAREGTLHAIDTTSSGWEHLWQVGEEAARIGAIARNATALSALFLFESLIGSEDDNRSDEVWTFDLPSHRLRGRRQTGANDPAFRGVLSPGGRLAVVDGGDAAIGAVRVLENGAWRPALAPYLGEQRLRMTDDWLLVTREIGDREVVQLLDTARLAPRARVEMQGALRAGGRIDKEHLLVFDDRGRLLVISLRSGSVLREMRLS